jgi:hypothetical protein
MAIISSKYQPIWDALKRDAVCKITAPPALHPRIIKAISKRKYEDLAFHFEMSEAGKRATIEYKKSGSVITFKLVKTFGVGDL